MAIKGPMRGGSGGEHPHGAPRSDYAINKTKKLADSMMGYETGNIPALMTADGIKQTAINVANNGHAKASAAGAAIGAGLLGGVVSAGVGDTTYYDGITSAPNAAMLGAAVGAAGKFISDTVKMPKSSRKQK
jgi:hypothetical protein